MLWIIWLCFLQIYELYSSGLGFECGSFYGSCMFKPLLWFLFSLYTSLAFLSCLSLSMPLFHFPHFELFVRAIDIDCSVSFHLIFWNTKFKEFCFYMDIQALWFQQIIFRENSLNFQIVTIWKIYHKVQVIQDNISFRTSRKAEKNLVFKQVN